MEIEDSKEIGIAVSSWPGSGSTTFSYILASLLHRKYLYIGDVFRYLSQKLGYTKDQRNEADFNIEDVIGHTIDNYTDYKLINDHNLIYEGDLAAFRLGKNPNIFSIFVLASKEERLRRIHLDQRQGAEMDLDGRDKMLEDKYKQLWGVEFYNKEYIAKKYNLVMDNSNMTVEEELVMALEEMNKYHKFDGQFNIRDLMPKIESEVENFWKLGKAGYKEKLLKKGMFYKPEEILQEITKQFPEDVIKFPKELQDIFLGKDL